MNYADATRLIYKLREIRVDRGATPGEQEAAQYKIKIITEKYGPVADLGEQVRVERERPKRRWSAPRQGPADYFFFDPTTGRASSNVIVHEWENPRNWHIEVPIRQPLPPHLKKLLRKK
jgi:hypothetical protein